jgi:hypothetical protein
MISFRYLEVVDLIFELSGVFGTSVRFSIVNIFLLLIKLVKQSIVVAAAVAHDLGLLINVVVVVNMRSVRLPGVFAQNALFRRWEMRLFLSFSIVVRGWFVWIVVH